MIKYKVKKYITERQKDLIQGILNKKSKNLLISPMKSAKTTFIFTDLLRALNNIDKQLIFVSPKVTLLDQLEGKYDVTKCYGKQGGAELKENTPVITTPDSLFKVINKCQELKKEFLIVYDEAHEFELSYKFRKKLAYPIKYYEHSKCIGLLCMTATPDNIIHSMSWDNIYVFDIEDRFIQAPITNIVTGLKNNAVSVTNYIIDLHKKDDTAKVIRINNKDTIKKVAKILKDTANIEVITWYRARENDNEKGDTHLQEILEGKKLKNEIILTTSLVDVGVEIYSEVKPIVISFMDSNSSLIEEIQFIGRFREGVKEFNIISPSNSFSAEFLTYEVIKSDHYEKAKKDHFMANRYDRDSKTLYPNLIATKDENGLYSYEIDTFAVNSLIFEKYISQIIKDTSLLREYLKEHLTFNSEVIRIVNVNEKNISSKEVNTLYEEIKQQEELEKAQFKEELKAFREKVKRLDNKQIELILKHRNELDLLTIHDKEVFKTIEEEYIFYHSEDMLEYQGRFKWLEGIAKWTEEKKKLLLIILDDKEYKNIEKQWEYIKANRNYNMGYKADPNNKLEQKVFSIRNTIIKLKGKERDVKLSEKFKGELLEALKENKCFAKLPPKNLTKHLNMIYNTNEQSIIKSAITNLKI